MCIRDRAISDYKIVGPQTTLPFGTFVMDHPAFVSGNIDTHFVKKHFTEEAIKESGRIAKEIAGRLALKIYLEEKEKLR